MHMTNKWEVDKGIKKHVANNTSSPDGKGTPGRGDGVTPGVG